LKSARRDAAPMAAGGHEMERFTTEQFPVEFNKMPTSVS
jgi:hypothetical protein